MTGDHMMAQLASELTQADKSGRGNRNVGVNHCVQQQSLTAMTAAAPTLMMPVIGSKRVTVAGQTYHITPGAYVTLPVGARFDVENIPDTRQNRFIGASLVFDPQTLELFRKMYGGDMAQWHLTPQWNCQGTDDLFASITQWVAHDRRFAADLTRTRHRLAEILLLLARLGVAGNLLLSHQSSLRERTRHLFALDPARNWRVADIAGHLAMSESTLRRQLRAEQTTFRDLLEEARLDRGVELVMMTDMPIGQVAFDCGYQSQSRFSERFRLRFSMSPTELRATQTRPSGDVVQLTDRRATS